MKKPLLLLLTITSFMLVACNSVIDVHKLTLNKNTLELKIDESETLVTTIAPNDIENPKLIWVVDDSSVATINSGTVTALKKGITDISVFLDLNENLFYDQGEPTDKCNLTVVDKVIEFVPVSSVTLNHASLSRNINEESTLIATVLPENASDKTLTWLSSNPSIVSVEEGKITAHTIGNATITAYVDENKNSQLDESEKYASCAVTVVDSNQDTTIWVASVALNKTSASIEKGKFETFNATVLPTNATYQTLTWMSSNPLVATVNTGRVDAVSVGQTTITAYVDENSNSILDGADKSATVAVTVIDNTITPDPDKDPIPASGESLPIGNKTVSGPNNTTPIDIKDWVNYDFSSSLPEYWSFIMGNNKSSSSSDFYAPSSGGGFKFSKTYYGLQSPLLTSWLKTEVRLTISQVNNNSASQSQYEGKPIFHIYSYDNTGHYIGMQTYEQQNKFADAKEIKFYIANPAMAYFEIRLNAFPYKGTQCYNFGVSQISIKGWPYGL